MARRKRDYYAVLGVERDASEADIKRAFRELARRHHPDVNPDDAGEAFREINEAYAVLSDREARARYDRWGHADSGGSGSGFGAVVDAAQEMINDVLRRRRGKQKGRDIRYTLEIKFEEAAFGCEKTIQVPDVTGKARDHQIVLPAGTKDGAVKVIKGEGEPGKGGAGAGDLHVIVRVAEHAQFRREGLDVHSEFTITFAQAALGAVLDLPTLDGPVKMRVPEGTQPGRVFRIRGRGIPQAAGRNAPRGDHLVRIQIQVPTELTARQRELIEELARTAGEQPGEPAPKKRLLDRVRSLLDE
jgi:DnaJ-class molecular chaperone